LGEVVANSYAQSKTVTCSVCGEVSSADVWLIVDTDERPDLVGRLRQDALHEVACGHCGATVGRIDAPLLLFQPRAEPPALFSPARRTTKEQDRQQADRLVRALRAQVGYRWKEKWNSMGVPYVPREVLTVALDEGVDAALRAYRELVGERTEVRTTNAANAGGRAEVHTTNAANAGGRTEVCTTNAPNAAEFGGEDEVSLLDQVWAFVEAGDAELEQVVETYPELLTPEGLNLLEGLAYIAREKGDEVEALRLAERLRLLGRFLQDRGRVFRM
jgi:hypothetical protein